MHDPEITIYTPDSSLANPRKMLADMFRDIVQGRDLAWRLAVRDISAQYRQTYLGFLWAFLLPLANTATWVFLSKSGIIAVGETALPYPVYVLTGTMLWAILLDAMLMPLGQTAAARPMLTRLNFPREAILISGLYQILFNASIKIVLMIGALLLAGIYPGWHLLLLPLGILSLILVGSAIGVLLTPLGMLYGDIGRAIPLAMQFLMYLTPVVYPLPKEGVVASLIMLNPITPIILTTRDWLAGFTPQFPIYFAAVTIAACLLLLVGMIVYRLAMPIIIERLSA